MALKQLMIQKKIEQRKARLEELNEKTEEFESRSTELETALDEAQTDEEVEVVEASIDELDGEVKKVNEEKKRLEDEIAELESQIPVLDDEERGRKSMAIKDPKDERMEKREAFNRYLHTYGAERAGLASTDGEVTIPTEVVYSPQKEINTVVDLSQYVTTTPVNTASGKYPVVKRASAVLNTVDELAKNPELAKPEFISVDWSVETYRGAIPLSQEAIDDSAVDLMGIVEQNAIEQRINTTNAKIASVLKAFTAKPAKSLDDIKKIINVELDTAYNRQVVATQSFYQAVDCLKDKNGRYILHEDVTSPSGKSLLGIPMYVVNDTLLGSAGDIKAFIGDLKRAVLMPLRKEISARWVDNEIYGQYLQIGMRFCVKSADAKAGYFVTFTPPVES